MKKIETVRLILRPLIKEDAAAVFKWAGDPIVNRYMPYLLHKDVHQAEEWISSLGDKNELKTLARVIFLLVMQMQTKRLGMY